jgi:hypothetical protein
MMSAGHLHALKQVAGCLDLVVPIALSPSISKSLSVCRVAKYPYPHFLRLFLVRVLNSDANVNSLKSVRFLSSKEKSQLYIHPPPRACTPAALTQASKQTTEQNKTSTLIPFHLIPSFKEPTTLQSLNPQVMAPSVVPVAPPPPTVTDEQEGPEKVTSKDPEPSTSGVEAADPAASPAPIGETTEVQFQAGQGKKKKKKKNAGPGATPKVKGHVGDSRLLEMMTLFADPLQTKPSGFEGEHTR